MTTNFASTVNLSTISPKYLGEASRAQACDLPTYTFKSDLVFYFDMKNRVVEEDDFCQLHIENEAFGLRQ